MVIQYMIKRRIRDLVKKAVDMIKGSGLVATVPR